LEDNELTKTLLANRTAITRFVALRCGRADVEDLVHELWLKAHQVETKVEKPLGYLYRMADRLVMDSHRGAARSRIRDRDWAFIHNRLSEATELPIGERGLIARIQLQDAEAALRAIGERASRIFRRYRIDGIDQRSIALEFGISISTVESDLRKCYQALLVLQEGSGEA
jgi:RNA polymerase sigma-70 factor (ECF subfamily)